MTIRVVSGRDKAGPKAEFDQRLDGPLFLWSGGAFSSLDRVLADQCLPGALPCSCERYRPWSEAIGATAENVWANCGAALGRVAHNPWSNWVCVEAVMNYNNAHDLDGGACTNHEVQ